MLQGLLEVLRNPRLKPILALNFCNYACTFTVQGLWGGPFLREVHGLSPIEAGNVLLCAVIAYQVGMLAFGPLDRLLDTRKGIAIGGTLVIICHPRDAGAVFPPAGLAADRRHHRHGLLLSASSTMVMTHGRGIFPDRLIGRGISTMNTCGHARRRLHADAVRHHHRRVRAAGRAAPAPRMPTARCSAR